jgi:phenylalanyl-tRNA synthetase beta chain
MPVVDIDTDEIRHLTGHEEKDDDELKSDLFGLGMEYEGETDEGKLQFELAPDRLDRLSVEGVARSLRYQYGDDRGVYVPPTNDAEWTIEVDESVPDERPYVTGAVIRGLDLSEAGLDSLIQLQEKLHATMGRKRAKGAIGIHDLTMLKGEVLDDREAPRASDGASDSRASTRKSITYRGIEPDGDTFVPLDSDAELTPGEVLRVHGTGEKYADLVADYERYPAIYDAIGLFSFPPVINGRRTEVSTNSRDLFVELTGTDQWTIDRMCAIICYALSARGATVEEVRVQYPDETTTDLGVGGEVVDSGRALVRPDFETDRKQVTHERIESVLGVDLDVETVLDLLERSGLGAETREVGDDEIAYDVDVPPYRVDVLHPLDVVDDVGRAYGFNDLEPRYPDVGTVGWRTARTRLEDAARNRLVGLGFEDLLNFHLISERENFERMGVARAERSSAERASGDSREPNDAVGGGEPATIRTPYSEDYTMVRTWALASLLMVLENNTHRSYPQDLAEIGLAAEVDDSENTGVAEHRTVAAVVARHDASYEDAKARLQALARSFDVELATPATEHPTFIDGRTADVVIDGESVGVIGEVHPEVLVERDLEVPVAAFEFRLDGLE